MISFREANRVRTHLKLPLSVYSWYLGSIVQYYNEQYSVAIFVKDDSSEIKKLVPKKINNVDIKVLVYQKE